MAQLLRRAEPWPVVMADGADDTTAAPVAAAALASPPAAAVLAPCTLATTQLAAAPAEHARR